MCVSALLALAAILQVCVKVLWPLLWGSHLKVCLCKRVRSVTVVSWAVVVIVKRNVGYYVDGGRRCQDCCSRVQQSYHSVDAAVVYVRYVRTKCWIHLAVWHCDYFTLDSERVRLDASGNSLKLIVSGEGCCPMVLCCYCVVVVWKRVV